MKRKNGFTLIELVVVIALIAILAVTLAPRLRDQIAKAGDSKAIAVLGSLRTQSEVFFAENERAIEGVTLANYTVADSASTTTTATTEFDILINDLDTSAQKLFAEAADNAAWTAGDNSVPIGGYRPSTDPGDLSYGSTIAFTFADPAGTSGDGISIWFSPTSGQELDTKKKGWTSY